jgi:hypothetical protein
MRIIDSYSDMIALFHNMNGGFDRSLWKTYADKIMPGLTEKLENDSREYDFGSQLLPVLNLAMASREKLEAAHHSFQIVTEHLAEKMRGLTGADMQVDVVFYFGLCNGAGWATTLNGNQIVLLGAEKIIELDWCTPYSMEGLLYHELGHIWHDIMGTMSQKTSSLREKYILQMYQEGVAMYIEQLLTNDFTHHHQNKGDWLDWCNSNRRELNQEYLRLLQANESAQDFFGDWNCYQGHSDVGYYLGCEFVKWLAKDHSLLELANLSIHELYESFTEYAKR